MSVEINTWSKSSVSTFWRFSLISQTPIYSRYLIEATTLCDALAVIKEIIPNFSENEWKSKKVFASGEILTFLRLKNYDKKYEILRSFKQRFAQFKILRENLNPEIDKFAIAFGYQSIEQYAKIQTLIDYSKWLDGKKNITIPQLQIYFANKGIKEYLIDGLTQKDLDDEIKNETINIGIIPRS